MSAAPVQLLVWFHGETPVTVALSPPADVTAWTLEFAILDGDAVILTKSVVKTNAATGVLTVTLAPDLDGPAANPPVALDPSRSYDYAVRRTDAGARDPGLAWGPLRFRVR